MEVVCQRALQVFQIIQLYISKSKKLPTYIVKIVKKYTIKIVKQATYTVKIVKEACNDPLMEAKISFFCSVAPILGPFEIFVDFKLMHPWHLFFTVKFILLKTSLVVPTKLNCQI